MKNKIYLKDLLFNIKFNIRKILLFSFFISLFVTIYSFFVQEKFKSNVIFLIENKGSPEIGNYSDLASLAGINLDDNQNSKVPPKSYPYLFNDFSFKREILNIKLNDELELKSYLKNDNKSFFDNLFNFDFLTSEVSNKTKLNSINLDSSFFVSKEEKFLFDELDELVSIDYDKKNEIIEIVCYLDDPIYVTILRNKVFQIFEKKIIDINIQSSRNTLSFNERNLDLKRKEYLNAEKSLASFKDNNQIISSNKFNTELFKLENEFNLINSIFKELSIQVEKSKLQVTKDTPIFTILDISEIPIIRHYPKRKSMIISSFFLAFITLSAFFAIKKEFYNYIKNLSL